MKETHDFDHPEARLQPARPLRRVVSTPEVITRVHTTATAPETVHLNFRTHRILYPEALDARGAKEVVFRGFLNYPDKIGIGERWFLYYWKILPGQQSAHTLIRVVARFAPDWSAIPMAQVTTRDVHIDLLPSMTMHFELRAFPYQRVPRAPRAPKAADGALPPKRDKSDRRFLAAVEDQRAWLDRQASGRGFTVDSVEAQSDVTWIRRTPEQVKNGKSDGWRQPYTDFTGTLTVKDPTVFRDRFFDGIGLEKAFGFGLLVLQPTR